MHIRPIASGPFLSRLWVEEDEFDTIAFGILDQYDLYPATPSPVNIELLVERIFGFEYTFGELPPAYLGVTTFGPDGPNGLTVHARLDQLDDRSLTHQCRSTLAHECSHGVLHTCLYRELWRRQAGHAALEGLPCLVPAAVPPADAPGQWWEYQANRLMAALLLPAPLVLDFLGPDWNLEVPYGRWPYFEREKLVADLADTFEVSRTLARYRLEDLIRKSLPKIRAAHLAGKSYASLALCWPDKLFRHLKAA